MSERKPAWRDEFLAAGYKPYDDRLRGIDEKYKPLEERMYVGSAQKRVDDERGTRYFLSVNFYDFRRHNGRRCASADVQFHADDEMRGQCINVSASVDGDVAQIEALISDIWHRQGWGYYEVSRDDIPAANAPRPRSTGRRERTAMSDQLPAEIAEAIENFEACLEGTARGYAAGDQATVRAALEAAILRHIRATDLGRSALAEEGRGT